jgi:hypothetical protein
MEASGQEGAPGTLLCLLLFVLNMRPGWSSCSLGLQFMEHHPPPPTPGTLASLSSTQATVQINLSKTHVFL